MSRLASGTPRNALIPSPEAHTASNPGVLGQQRAKRVVGASDADDAVRPEYGAERRRGISLHVIHTPVRAVA